MGMCSMPSTQHWTSLASLTRRLVIFLSYTHRLLLSLAALLMSSSHNYSFISRPFHRLWQLLRRVSHPASPGSPPGMRRSLHGSQDEGSRAIGLPDLPTRAQLRQGGGRLFYRAKDCDEYEPTIVPISSEYVAEQPVQVNAVNILHYTTHIRFDMQPLCKEDIPCIMK